MKIARLYLRVSTDSQDLQRQERLIVEAQAAGHDVAGVYREKASGARADRPELLRMIQDLQAGEIVIAEKIDRINHLPLEDAEKLVATIRAKRAKLAVPGIVDLSEVSAEAEGVSKVVLDSVQDMLLKVSPQMAREDYRRSTGPATARHRHRPAPGQIPWTATEQSAARPDRRAARRRVQHRRNRSSSRL